MEAKIFLIFSYAHLLDIYIFLFLSLRLSENVLPKEAEEMKRQEMQRARKVREEHASAERMEEERKVEEGSMWREVADYARYDFRSFQIQCIIIKI